ncbi:MAG: hypothetical protein EXQ94_04485 [Alphaproteobacteria bacterium]|nr:hypothetical protein [Alphaproteobacteria bacterium]
MWQLFAADALDQATSFPSHDLDPAAIDGLGCRTPYHLELWDSLAEIMERTGHHDPARRFEALARFGRVFLSTRGERLLMRLQEFDERILGGRVAKHMQHRAGEVALPKGVAIRSAVRLHDPARSWSDPNA